MEYNKRNIEYVNRAQALDEILGNGHVLRGESFGQMGEVERGFEEPEIALKLSPNDSKVPVVTLVADLEDPRNLYRMLRRSGSLTRAA